MSVAVRIAAAGRLVRRCAIVLGCLAALAAAPTALGATVPAFGLGSSYKAIVSAGHPAPPTGWELPGFDDSGWGTFAAPFSNAVGSSAGCGFAPGVSFFPVFGRVVARKSFTLPAGATSLHLFGTIDNDASIYVNGTLVGSVADGSCHLGGINFTTSFGLVAGTNVVAAVADDFGGATFFDMQAEYQLAAPVVTANVSGSLGSNGWYTGDVTVSWTLSGGGATSTSGCGTTVVTTDTAGTTFTCTATNAAGSDTKSVTIKRDATAPSIGGSQAPPPNGNGWNNTNVTVSFSCADNPGGSGIDTDTVAGATLTGNAAGQSVTNSGACVDMAGNAAASKTIGGISIDKVKPVLAPSVAPNPVALNGVAVASANATDALSGIDTFGCGAVDTSAIGPGTVSCTATDKAGNTQSATASYLVTVSASKQAVLDAINAELATADKRDRPELRKAAKHLTESLDPDNWIDGNHLTKKGEQVFQDEKEAVQKLEQLLKDKKSGVADATLQDWIDTLVTIDEALARIAIDEATAAGGDAKKLAEAEKEMAKSASELTKGKEHDAIEQYKNAWKKAKESLEKS